METISREDLIGDYGDMMKSEAHHNHEIIKDKNGIIQWKPDPLIELIIDAYGITKILGQQPRPKGRSLKERSALCPNL